MTLRRLIACFPWVCFAALWGMTGCGDSKADYGKPGDSTLPQATPFDSAPAQSTLPDRKVK